MEITLMKTLVRSTLLLAALCWMAINPSVTQAVTLLSDDFSDNNRDGWYAISQHATLRGGTQSNNGNLESLFVGASSSMTILSYFTPSGTPYELANIGDFVKVTADITMDEVKNSDNGFRIGFFNSNATRLTPQDPPIFNTDPADSMNMTFPGSPYDYRGNGFVDTTSNGGLNTADITNFSQGYQVRFNPSTRNGTAAERNTTQSSALFANNGTADTLVVGTNTNGAALTVTDSGTPNAVGTPFPVEFKITRTGLASLGEGNFDQLTLTATFNGGSYTYADTAGEFLGDGILATTAFDHVAFFYGSALTSNTPTNANLGISIDNVVVSNGVTPPGVAGDYSQNGTVDAADYTTWRDNVGGTSIPNEGAGISPGTVDSADYNFWVSRFNATSSAAAAASTAVPEPTTAILAVIMLGALGFRAWQGAESGSITSTLL